MRAALGFTVCQSRALPSPQIHWRIAGAVFLQHVGGGETPQPFLCGTIAQACHALQDATGEAGVGGKIVAAEVIMLRTQSDWTADGI